MRAGVRAAGRRGLHSEAARTHQRRRSNRPAGGRKERAGSSLTRKGNKRANRLKGARWNVFRFNPPPSLQSMTPPRSNRHRRRLRNRSNAGRQPPLVPSAETLRACAQRLHPGSFIHLLLLCRRPPPDPERFCRHPSPTFIILHNVHQFRCSMVVEDARALSYRE